MADSFFYAKIDPVFARKFCPCLSISYHIESPGIEAIEKN